MTKLLFGSRRATRTTSMVFTVSGNNQLSCLTTFLQFILVIRLLSLEVTMACSRGVNLGFAYTEFSVEAKMNRRILVKNKTKPKNTCLLARHWEYTRQVLLHGPQMTPPHTAEKTSEPLAKSLDRFIVHILGTGAKKADFFTALQSVGAFIRNTAFI